MGFHMIDVGSKNLTRRRAVASGALRMGKQAFELVKAGRLPKGDALSLAEVAGIFGAKRTAQTIPLCHPIALDSVVVTLSLDARLPGVRARCQAVALAKTGVEMEALSGVSAALLSVYDLVKQVDPVLTISDIQLDLKEGGKSGLWRRPSRAPSQPTGRRPALGPAAVITVSDRCHAGRREDRSGPLLADGLKAMGFSVKKPLIVPDERQAIQDAVRKAARAHKVVALTGGTGLSPRDVTPEAVLSLCQRPIPGIGEALRAAGMQSLPAAALSRSAAGQLGRSLVVCLPGSSGGVRDGLKVLAELLPHALHVVDGGDHE